MRPLPGLHAPGQASHGKRLRDGMRAQDRPRQARRDLRPGTGGAEVNIDAAHEFREAARLRGLPQLPEAPPTDLGQDVWVAFKNASRRQAGVRIITQSGRSHVTAD